MFDAKFILSSETDDNFRRHIFKYILHNYPDESISKTNKGITVESDTDIDETTRILRRS